ncbi:MAG: DUF2207 domain-containing protein [Aggregatilineales bacterium]
MRLKSTFGLMLLGLLLAAVPSAFAQSPSIDWAAWNAQITASANSSQLAIAETQNIKVTGGTLHAGERDFSDAVTIQNVYIALNGQQPQQLSQGSGNSQYQVSNTNGQVVLNYTLPTPANAGDSFVVQINYTVNEAMAGVIDWNVVPGTHSVPIDSSSVTINFPDGQAPNPSLVRIVQGSGNVTTSGNSITVTAQGSIPANQSFEIQLPYGAAASGGNNPVNPVPNNNPGFNNNPIANNGAQAQTGFNIPIWLICVGGCVLGVIALLLMLRGGTGLLGGLVGGLLGGAGSSLNRGGPINRGGGGGGFFGGSGGSPGGTGFRDSANQNREVPNVSNDKKSGGGGSFS